MRQSAHRVCIPGFRDKIIFVIITKDKPFTKEEMRFFFKEVL